MGPEPGPFWKPIVAVVAFALLAIFAWLSIARRRRLAEVAEAQRALLVSEERLRLALDATTDVVWDWDVEKDAIYHPRWAHAYGFPEERTPRTGGELAPYLHPDDLGRFNELLGGAVEGRRDEFDLEHRALDAAGEWRWTRAHARVVARDADGRATRIVGTCADVTERRRMLEQLQLSDRLAAVGTLAAGVAHEINNPLAYLVTNVEHTLEVLRPLGSLLESGETPPAALARSLHEGLAALEEAVLGATRVRNIVRDLKVFSRADADERAPTSVVRVLRGAINFAGPEIRRRARLVVDLGEVPTVVANESRLTQVFVNLLVNAAQSLPEGRPDQHEVAVSTRVDAVGRVVVDVRDTGCGISPADQKRIFDPFFTTKPVGVGTGLGLAICHGIVTAIGGEILVESSPGRGSTFRVCLPGSGEPEPIAAPSPPRPAARRARVLLVDDEDAFCRAIARVLSAEHDVVATSDPLDALRRVEGGERFDVLLTDVVMPRLSGMELHALVEKSAPALAGRTLFITGGATHSSAAEFLSKHRGRVIEKPCDATALRAAISAALAREPSPPLLG